jgi:ubiquinone/menaquinone biosynthesis C-methylase UbiE
MSDDRGADREVYSLRDLPAFEQVLMERTVEGGGASFLQPHLRPGMRLLDCGCGPGTVTHGLTEAVAPGEAVGIDIDEGQVERARALAAERGVRNVRFEVGDAYQLPFEDGSFDAVYSQFLLMHLSDPVRALEEMRRVLHAGGVACVSEIDAGTLVRWPETPLMAQMRDMEQRVARQSGGDYLRGRRQRELLLEAGFARVEAGAFVMSAGTLEETRRAAGDDRARFEGVARTALELGWVDQETLDAMYGDLGAWGERPDAFSAITHCWAIGWAG